jgi:hypothetical protein
MRKRVGHAPVVALLAALIVYTAVYALTVERSPYLTITTDGRALPLYEICGRRLPNVASLFFGPALQIDMLVRREYWYPDGTIVPAD